MFCAESQRDKEPAVYPQQCRLAVSEVGKGRIGPKSAPRVQAEDEASSRLASALQFCARALRNLDVDRIRDPRARTWVRTIARAVEAGTEADGPARLSAREQAAFVQALDCFTSWLQAEPRRMVWG
jgi:hypothetical protein